MDVNHEKLFSGQLPTRIVIGLVNNQAFNGHREQNPFNFINFNLQEIGLYLDGQQQHSVRPIQPNFASWQYIRAYNTIFSGTGKLGSDEGLFVLRPSSSSSSSRRVRKRICLVTRLIWLLISAKTITLVFNFNLQEIGLYLDGQQQHSVRPIQPNFASWHYIRAYNTIFSGTGKLGSDARSVRLALKFRQALAVTVTVIAYAEFENVIEIDRNRNVVFDFGVWTRKR